MSAFITFKLNFEWSLVRSTTLYRVTYLCMELISLVTLSVYTY